MIICRTLDVTPEWLLSGIEAQGTRGNPQKWHVVDAETDSGRLLTSYNSLDARLQQRLLGYAENYLRDNTAFKKITVNAAPYAYGFYHTLGFRDTDGQSVKDGIVYTPMEKMI